MTGATSGRASLANPGENARAAVIVRSPAMNRAVSFVLPSVIAGMAAATLAGLIEALLHVQGALGLAVAAGGAAPAMAAAGALLSIAARGVAAGWRPRELVRDLVEDGGSAPRLAAWALVALGSVAALGASMLFGVERVMLLSKVPGVVAVAAALIVVMAGFALLAVSRPLVDAIARPLRWLAARRPGALRPRNVALALGATALGLCAAAWPIALRPRLGDIDLGILPYTASFAVALVGAHLLLRLASPRRRAVASVAVALAMLACTAASVAARYRRPFVLLDVWGRAPFVGFVVGQVYDIEAVRSSFPLGELRAPERPGARHPTIILVTVDTFRADRSSVYGGPAATRALDKLAREGTVFQWAFSPGNVTRRSIPAIATGLSPRRIRGRVAGWALRMDPRHVALAERFAASGYDTAGFFCCRSHFGPEHLLGTDRGIAHLRIIRDGEELVAEAVDWLRERERAGTDRPAMLWLHLIEPHTWRKQREAARAGGLKGRYDAVIEQTDRALDPLVRYAIDPARRDSTVLVVTSDHGEGLGDHGVTHHAASLYNSEIRVPLLIAGGGVRTQRIDMPVGLVDLPATLLDLAGFTPPGMPATDGRTLGPYLRGEKPATIDQGEAYSVMIADRSVARSAFALVRGRHKMIMEPDKPPELYDIVADPSERTNLFATQPDVLARLRKALDDRRRIDRIPPFGP